MIEAFGFLLVKKPQKRGRNTNIALSKMTVVAGLELTGVMTRGDRALDILGEKKNDGC